jgi:DNA-binding MarR family transcriptional regulator
MSDAREPLRAWLALLGVSGALKKNIDARMRSRFGLSLSRFDVLAALDRAGECGLNGGALSAQLKVTEGNTTQVTAPLVAQGFVSRSVSRADARVAIFKLTAKGRRLFDRMAEANRAWVAGAFAGLSPAQVAQLRALLAAIETAPAAAEEHTP